MATNARKQTIPAGSDTTISRDTIFKDFGNSIRDVVPVANTTERAQLVTDLTAEGEGPSGAKALVVHRADAPGLHRIESTTNGTVWIPASGELIFADKAAADSWATSNSSFLTTGDVARAGGAKYTWSGTAWVLDEVHFGYVKTGTFFWQTAETDHTWNATASEGTLAGFTTTDQITFTCTVPGSYLIQGAITADTGTSPLDLSFFKNGTAFRIFNSVAHSAAYTSVPFAVSTRFAVNNTFKIRIRGSAASTAGVPGAQTFFTVDRIGA